MISPSIQPPAEHAMTMEREYFMWLNLQNPTVRDQTLYLNGDRRTTRRLVVVRRGKIRQNRSFIPVQNFAFVFTRARNWITSACGRLDVSEYHQCAHVNVVSSIHQGVRHVDWWNEYVPTTQQTTVCVCYVHVGVTSATTRIASRASRTALARRVNGTGWSNPPFPGLWKPISSTKEATWVKLDFVITFVFGVDFLINCRKTQPTRTQSSPSHRRETKARRPHNLQSKNE